MKSIAFNTEALEALRKEFERNHPGQVFTAEACADLIIQKLHEAEKTEKKPPKK